MTTSQPSELVERLTRPIIGIENRTSLETFDIMCDRIRRVLERLSSSEVTEAYCEGLLTAERMVRRCIGEDNEELIIDVDDGIPAHKPTLIYVAEALSNRAHRAAMRSAATSERKG